MAIGTDSSLTTWGGNYWGECNVPEPNQGFTAVSGGWGHTLGLKADGSVVAWGMNSLGQCNVPDSAPFVAISASNSHSLGLTSEGVIAAWGAGGQGQSGYPHYGQSMVPEPNQGF